MPKFKQLENHTYEAALDLGAEPVYAFFHIVLPDIMPGIVSGFLLSFTMSVDDFVITHFTRGAGINTLSTLIYSQVKIGVRPTLYALSTAIFVLVLLVLIIVNVLSSSRKDKGDYYAKNEGGITPKKSTDTGAGAFDRRYRAEPVCWFIGGITGSGFGLCLLLWRLISIQI